MDGRECFACGTADVLASELVSGAGTAIAHALAAAGVRELHVLNREPERAGHLIAALQTLYPDLVASTQIERLRTAALAINATSLGLHAGDALPFDPSWLPAGAALFDIIAARDTELMSACQARGLVVVGGRPMIDHQVAAQIAFWRGECAVSPHEAITEINKEHG